MTSILITQRSVVQIHPPQPKLLVLQRLRKSTPEPLSFWANLGQGIPAEILDAEVPPTDPLRFVRLLKSHACRASSSLNQRAPNDPGELSWGHADSKTTMLYTHAISADE